jgi:hypothetical protein
MVAPTERRARSAMRSLQGKPISRCCAALSVPSATAVIQPASCARASSPSLAGGASAPQLRAAASTARAAAGTCPSGSGGPAAAAAQKASAWKAIPAGF